VLPSKAPRSLAELYVGYSTFRRRKKAVAGKHACLVGDRAFRGLFALLPLCRSEPNVSGARYGDEGKAVGSVLPTALLIFEPLSFMPTRRFPPPWTAEETSACFLLRDADGEVLAYVYCEEMAARLLTKDEARRIAANIAKLPGDRRSSLKQVCNPDCYDAACRK
jgi:hypothetical protein